MKKIVVVVMVVVAVILVMAVGGGLGGIKFFQIKKLMSMPMMQPPETISSVVAKEEKWQDTFSAVGTVTAAQGVEVSTEVGGIIREITFDSGSMVTNGAVLVRLDTSSEEAQLRAIEAQVALSKVNAERLRTLLTANTISQSELDTAEATLKQNQANADNIRATIAKKTIRAPFAGQLGIRKVNLGQFLEMGKPIVSLQALEPMHAEFSLPQQSFGQLKSGLKVHLATDAFEKKQFEGTITAINPQFDDVTRSVRVQATFENAEHLLRAGMFARVEVVLPTDQNVLVVPSTALLSAPFGNSVYVIEPSTNKEGGFIARQQFVKTGTVRGDFVTVESGLKAGDKVASSGVFKLRNGVPVKENNEMVPKASTTPKPSDS
ncbi:MAG: efflux transporter, family, subunit [Verrucomicrobiales bacterium]|nr:efflux transporter, family, subunit [Verrucomicrobiales bacterium]